VTRPILETERLLLRPFRLDDAPDVKRLAGAREVATTTLRIPHPYPDGAAEMWIGGHQAGFERGESVDFAVVRREDGALVGAVGLELRREHDRAELGYWIGVPFWNRGYATEAASAVLAYAFESLELNRVFACHFANNPASGRVLQKIGMTHEGTRRAHTLKWGEYLDDEAYGILRTEWTSQPSASVPTSRSLRGS
jgi:ribosomal-protein-alanine N-acetyltransferase